MSSASAISQWGFRVHAPSGPPGRARELLAPGPDRDVRVGVADRDAGIGRVGDAQQGVLELRFDLGDLGVQHGDPLARGDRRGAQRRNVGAVGSRAAANRLADPLRGGVSLGLERVGLAEERPPSRVERQRGVDERRVLALVERTPADDVRLLAEPLQPDAHDPASLPAASPWPAASRRRFTTNSWSRLARSQPARGPFGRPRTAR